MLHIIQHVTEYLVLIVALEIVICIDNGWNPTAPLWTVRQPHCLTVNRNQRLVDGDGWQNDLAIEKQ